MTKKYTVFLLVSLCYFGARAQISATASAYFGCPPLTVNFTDNSGGNPTCYYWDFDVNGATSTLQNASETYISPGVYNILHVVCYGNVMDSEYILIRVFEPPQVDFGSANRYGCVEPCHMVNFVNLTIPGESPVKEYVWDFGDGSLAYQGYSATHCYDSAYSFDVTLVALDSNGCEASIIKPNYVVIGNKPTANITINPTQSCFAPRIVNFTGSGSSPNGPVNYEWYFDTASYTSSLQNPTFVYYNGIYNPFLIVSDTLGCQDTAYGHVEITQLQAGFKVSSVQACQGLPVQFTDTSNFASGWKWTFGDGTTDTVKNPTHIYANTGTYTVTLAITYNNCTATATQTNYINVTAPVNFTISANVTSSCTTPLTVNFSSNPAGSGIVWNFGDGSPTSNVQNPTHTYTTRASDTVTVSVANAQGCVNTKVFPNYINIADIHAGFTVDSPNGCAPLTVHFTSTSTSNPAIANYQWNFGDGGSQSGATANPTYVYNNQGIDTATLIITNAAGCMDTATGVVITVGSKLVPNFVAAPMPQCVDQPVKFQNLTTGMGPHTTEIWSFGDGSVSNLDSPTHTYRDTGYYTVSLTIVNQGCSSDTIRLRYEQIIVPRANFKDSFSCGDPNNIIFTDLSEGANTWLWSFGDNSTSNVQNPTHLYANPGVYHVTLTVSNTTTLCVDSFSQQITVGAPQTKFVVDTNAGCYPLTIIFTDSSHLATSWKWIFGDGTSSTGENPIHTYPDSSGTYTVMLITNPGPCADTLTKVNYITAYGPKALFGVSPATGCVPLLASFTDSSQAYKGAISNWNWQFGTGDSINHVQNPQYVYDTSGVFNVTLRVTDSHGCTASAVRQVKPVKPVASFVSDTAICANEQVRFTNTSKSANKYTWFFGDGGTSTATSPLHTYGNSGYYTITLIAVDSVTGCNDTVVKPNYLNVDTPVASFYVNSSFNSCPPFPVQFYNTTSRPNLSFLWYFGDGDTSTFTDPLHVYFFPGQYTVTLIAHDTAGCSNTKTDVDLIKIGGPVGHFNVTPSVGCVPVTVTFTGTVQSHVSIVADLGDGTTYNDTLDLVHTYSVPGIYYPTYTLTDSVGCEVVYPVDTIIAGLIPYPGLPPDTTVCKGNYVQFNLPYGNQFIWESNLSPDYLSCDTCQSTLSTSPDTITYYVTAITDIGCVAKDTITVNVDALPLIFPGLTFAVCPNDTLQLSAGEHVAAAIWTPDQFINDTSLVDPLVWPPDTTTYRVTGFNDAGCSISRIVTIFSIQSVAGTLISSDTTLCDGAPFQISGQITSASSTDTFFRWIPPNYLSSATIENPILAGEPPGDYDYTLVINSSTCTPDTNHIHIVVSSKPVIDAGDDQTVATGTPVQIWVSTPDNALTYQWYNEADSLSCNNCTRPTLVATQTQTIYIDAKNQAGCDALDSVIIRVVACSDSMVFVPNTFTPNGDGRNDVLYVRGAGLSQLEYFRVYNRWGEMVFQTENISEGWDGRIGGKEAPQGTYAYMLRGICSSGSTIDKSGNVTLMR